MQNFTRQMKRIAAVLSVVMLIATVFVSAVKPAMAVLPVQPTLGSIYVGNLSFDTTEEDLQEIFSDYGTVKQVQLPTDRETGRMRGFGFVDMSTEDEEAAAIEGLDGAEWLGREIKVNKTKPRENRGQGGRRGGSRGGFSRRY